MHALFSRAQQRVRWRAYLALALLMALVVGAVVATLSAATRSERAFRDLRAATHATDVAIGYSGDGRDAAVRAVARQPGVLGAAAETELFVRPAGHDDLFPDFNLLALAPASTAAPRVDGPVVVAGRVPDPRRAEEVALSEQLARRLGVHVGDRLRLESMTDRWVDVAFNGGDAGPADGPTVHARVVGILRTPADFGHWEGILHLTPAFVHRYGTAMRTYHFVEARVPRVTDRHALRPITAEGEVGASPFADDAATGEGLRTIATALRLVAGVALLAGGAVVALALGRLTRLTLADRSVLVALGATRAQVATGALLALVPWLALGTVVGVGVGIVAAPHALVGLAARVDPTLGAVRVDAAVTLAVAVAACAVAVVIVVGVAARAAPRSDARRRPAPRLVPLGAPLGVVLGLRRALVGEPRLGGRSSRAAIAVTALAVAGALAALAVSASIGELQTNASLSGQGGDDRLVDSGESIDAYEAALATLAADRRVATLAGLHITFGVAAGGRRSAMLAVDVRRGTIEAGTVEGRPPSGPRDVALGPATLAHLGKSVGDPVRLRWHGAAARFRIVGAVLFPEGDFTYDDGIAVTGDGAARLVGDLRATSLHQVLFAWAPRVDAHAADRTLRRAGLDFFGSEGGLRPARVTNLGQVEQLPKYLAGFLVALALATFGYAVALSSRRRAHESALLRALGCTARQSAAAVVVQAAVVVALALALAVPVGLVAGERVWRAIATDAHVVVRTVVSGGSVAVVLGGVVLVATAITAVVAWRVARLRVAPVLRAE